MNTHAITIEPVVNLDVSDTVSSEEMEDGLLAEQGLSLLNKPGKDVNVSRDERYTTIQISTKREQEVFNNQLSDCYMKVKIKKDRVLETTETHVQKLFISYADINSEDLNVVIRDIYVDRVDGKSKRDVKTARKKMKRKDFFEALNSEMEFLNPKTFMLAN